MSLFKERSANSRKVISLENTIIALKKEIIQLRESKGSQKPQEPQEPMVSQELFDSVKLELEQAQVRIAELEETAAQPKKRSYKKRSKKDLQDETQS